MSGAIMGGRWRRCKAVQCGRSGFSPTTRFLSAGALIMLVTKGEPYLTVTLATKESL